MKRILTFDLETTGLSFETDRIIQCAIVITDEDGLKLEYNFYINPGFPIPPEATEIHKITDEMVADCPRFEEYANVLFGFFMEENTIICGFNIMGFDFRMLQAEFTRCGLPFSLVGREVLEMGNLVKLLFPRTLEAMFKQEIGLAIEELFGSAHDALNDTKATNLLMYKLIEKIKANNLDLSFVKDELPQIEPQLSLIESAKVIAPYSRFGNNILDIEGKFKTNSSGKTIFGFGKYMGEVVDADNSNHIGFLQWMRDKDFKPDTLKIVDDFLQ